MAEPTPPWPGPDGPARPAEPPSAAPFGLLRGLEGPLRRVDGVLRALTTAVEAAEAEAHALRIRAASIEVDPVADAVLDQLTRRARRLLAEERRARTRRHRHLRRQLRRLAWRRSVEALVGRIAASGEVRRLSRGSERAERRWERALSATHRDLIRLLASGLRPLDPGR